MPGLGDDSLYAPSSGGGSTDLLAGAGMGLASGVLGLIGQGQQNIFNAQMVGQQESFQANMANTQYQRGVADMRAAGLNPALMFGSAGPAPSPTGAIAQGANPMQAASASAQQLSSDLLKLKQNQPLVDAQVEATKAQGVNSLASARQANATAGQTEHTSIPIGKAADAISSAVDNVGQSISSIGHSSAKAISGWISDIQSYLANPVNQQDKKSDHGDFVPDYSFGGQ